MASIQERLQLKRVPLDTWNIREQLCLASAVVRSGDQNWMSVSRALKTVGEPNRPPDWYSQKSCAAQYGTLLEHVETPKRKKRSSEGAVETPQESIVKRLTQDRIAEIQKNIAEMNQQYEQLKNEISEVRNLNTSEERLREIWGNIEATKRANERETARRAALLKEREERRARVARNSAGSLSTPSSPSASAVPPSSPLLTSLLKSSPVVTTPQHMPHPASVVDTMSPSVTAPTLSMLLEKSSPQQESCKRAAIEHIKSQLQQIEHQLKANTPPPAPLAPPVASGGVPPVVGPVVSTGVGSSVGAALDIDDIEINAEDVYVFRDVDIHIPNVTTAHTPHKSIEKHLDPPKKEEDEPVAIEDENIQKTPLQEDIIADKEEPTAVELEVKEETPPDIEMVPLPVEEVPPISPIQEQTLPEPVAVETEEVKIAFPEVKFPTTEIKIIQPDEQKIKEEKEPETVVEEKQPEVEPEAGVQEQEKIFDAIEQQISDLHAETPTYKPRLPSPLPPEPVPQLESEVVQQPVEPPVVQPIEQTFEQPIEQPIAQPVEEYFEQTVTEVIETHDIPLPPYDPVMEEPAVPQPPEEQEPQEPEAEPQPEVKEEEPETADVTSVENVEEDPDPKREEDAESNDSIPLKQMIREECFRAILDERAVEDAHTETDDDTPMEVSREEEKDGKKRKDYSRKKKPDSRRSSSAAEASAPESPSASANPNTSTSASASEADRQHRLWKKSVMLVYTRLCGHKYASLFLRPISDEEAPGYSLVVKRPMDLSTIRRHIDTGVLRTTAQFQRAVLLMLSNALVYNSSEHSVYTMAKEMHEEAASQLGMLLAAQAHAGLVEADVMPSRRKRRHPDNTPKRQH